MHEDYFAPASERRRRTVDDLRTDYPSLEFDAERDAADRAEASFIQASLDEFIARLNGRTPSAAFAWDNGSRERISPHPVYQREVYRTRSFDDLPTLNRAMLRTYPTPFDYEATAGSTVYTDRTSGTSGAPLTVYYSQTFMAQYLHLNMIKVALAGGIEGIGRRPVFSVRITDNQAYKGGVVIPNPLDLVGLSVIHHVDVTQGEAFEELARLLADLDPEVVIAKPNLHKILLEHWEREGAEAPIRPLMVVSGGAMLLDELRGRIGGFFGCPVISAYAISEAGYLGSECPRRHIHLDETVHERFESVPVEGAAEDDTARGELTVTSMSNDCMPLVRYRVGDLVDFTTESCACGRPGPLLRELRGRTTIVFDLGNGFLLSPTRYMDMFKDNPELVEYQLTQKQRRSFHLGIELRSGLAAHEREAALVRIRNTVEAGMPVPAELTLEERVFEGEGAKFARFRSEVTA
ncbi:hypothetical protein ACISU4_01205 [Streptomyces wuyuanensis]|uniref:hypothetical protein n=1 Tax=Streptomyces wuyuanensis TaxID=1196353 RepID=UPI00381E8E73